MQRIFIILAVWLLLPLVVFGQVWQKQYHFLTNTAWEKQVFFPLPSYKKNQSVIPDSSVNKIQFLLNQFNNIETLTWIGTADLETRVYRDLAKGILADKFYAATVNAVAAQQRASAAVEKWGGKLDWRLVNKKVERGLILTIQLRRPPLAVVDITLTTPEIRVYPGQSFSLAGLAQVTWNDLRTTRPDCQFSFTDSAVVELDTLSGNGVAKRPGMAKVVVRVPNSQISQIMDTVKVKVLPWPQHFSVIKVPTAVNNRWRAYGLIASHSQAGVGLILKFPTGWLLNADYSYVNWNVYYEQAWNVRLGHQLKFIPSKIGELYMTAGVGRGQQLANSWTAQWATMGLLYNFHLTKGIYFMCGADAQYKFIHQRLKLGPLEFYQLTGNPQTLYYRQPIIQPEKNGE